MTSDQLTAMMNRQTQIFKECLDLFNRENNKKFDKYEGIINRMSNELIELKRSIEFSQNEPDDYKQRVKTLEEEGKKNEETINALDADVKKLKDI